MLIKKEDTAEIVRSAVPNYEIISIRLEADRRRLAVERQVF
jgi:hypothetical protein